MICNQTFLYSVTHHRIPRAITLEKSGWSSVDTPSDWYLLLIRNGIMDRSEVGVTNAPFVKILRKEKIIWITFIFDSCHRSWAAVTPVKYKRDIQWLTCVLAMLKNEENNGTGEMDLVTPTPGWLWQNWIGNSYCPATKSPLLIKIRVNKGVC